MIFTYLSFFLFFSCEKNNLDEKIIEKELKIIIEDKSYTVQNEKIGCNENCNLLFVRIQNLTSTNGRFSIYFDLTKKGIIKNIQFVDYNDSNDLYESADFNPKGLFSITNFEYDEAKKYLYFEFKGELVKISVYNDLDKNHKRKKIEGSISIKNIINTNCTTFIPDLNFQTDNFYFSTNTPFATHDSGLKTNPYQFFFYSDNGYRTIIKSKVNLWDLDIGTYSFDQNSIENRIDFEQYIGNFRATQLLWVREIDWKKYQTSGSYTILEHKIINGQKVTKGKFNIQIFDRGELKYNITDIKFDVTGF